MFTFVRKVCRIELGSAEVARLIKSAFSRCAICLRPFGSRILQIEWVGRVWIFSMSTGAGGVSRRWIFRFF